MRTASRLLARAYDSALQGTDLNVTQLAVLRAIERMRGRPLSQVADQLSMDRTSMYRSLGKMVDHGWLTLTDGPDARSRCAVVTKRGRAALDRAAPRWESIQSDVVSRFGRRRWRELVEELRALSDVVEVVSGEKPERARKEKSS